VGRNREEDKERGRLNIKFLGYFSDFNLSLSPALSLIRENIRIVVKKIELLFSSNCVVFDYWRG